MTTEKSLAKEFSEEALYAESSAEINKSFRELELVQKIEIYRRFDIAQAIGLRAHVLNEDSKKETESIEANSKKESTCATIFFLFIIIFLSLKFGAKGLFQFDDNWGYLCLAPLAFYMLLRYESFAASRKIARINSEIDVIKFRWREVVAGYTLDDYVRHRVRRKIDCDTEGTYSLTTIALKRAIVNEVSFKYDYS